MYKIELNSIQFSNGVRYRFPAEIADVVEFEEALVIRLSSFQITTGYNVYSIDHRGNLLWKVPTPRTFAAYNPYVGLYRSGGYVEALNWDGHVLTLHPKNGMIIGEGFYTGGGILNRRTPSVRRWI